MKKVVVLISAVLLLWGLLACSTTKGSLLKKAAERDRKDSKVKISKEEKDTWVYEKPAEEEKWCLVIDPTPSDVGSGGFLQVVSVPPGAEIYFGSSWVPAGKLYDIGPGSHIVRVRAFGFEDQSVAVNVARGRTTVLAIDLKEVGFMLSNLEADKLAFNPRNSGLFGNVRIRFLVSGPGSGRAVIVDSQDRIVMSRNFGAFTAWEQGFDWDGRDRQGEPLPNGTYTVRIQAQGTRDGERESAELRLKIDSSMVTRFRSLWSGSAGLLYAPTPEILPSGKFQVSSGILVHASSGADEPIVRIPVNFAMRAGLADLLELDTSIGGNIAFSSDMLYLPWFVTAAFKASLLRIPGNLALATSAQIKLTYRSVHTDTLANSSGLSVGLPAAIHWGSFSLLFSPELIFSPYTVSYDPDEILEPDLYGWLYGRAGLLLDMHPFSFGASLTLRTLPFNEGLGLDLPFQTALEAHWQFSKSPGRSRFLSLYLAGEFESVDSYYLLGGVGLGILN